MRPARPPLEAPRLFTLVCAALLAAAALAAPARAQDDEVVRVESDLVVLNVTVTDRAGGFVHKLSRRDFRVLEDDVEQPIQTFAVEENPFAAAVLIDTSGSMEGRVTLARAAAIRFLAELRPDDVAAL